MIAVAATAALSIGSLLVINDVDEPFAGAIRIDATEMANTATDLTEDFTAVYGPGRLPCDERGTRT
ncbi:hypothetical protein [Amycolatopsis anabasis]|uniref:hypothetical protein n=1 Tax=Amycolatopsis anabasis TaxID=1840409 RepID=UPI00131D60AC|nr:hypothetical protein [Amycolatopsis anabasis]